MGFNDFVYFAELPASAVIRPDEVDEKMRERLAGTIQERLRARFDPGIDLGSNQTERPRVRVDAAQIVITRENDNAVLSDQPQGNAEDGGDGGDEDGAGHQDDLFELGTGIPRWSGGKMTFRTITLDSLFGVTQYEQDSAVEQIVTHTLQQGIVDATDGASEEVEWLYPIDKFRYK